MSLLRLSPKELRPWSVICGQLSPSQQTIVRKFITYFVKLRLRDLKELSVLRLSPRFFRPWSVILLHLSSSHFLISPLDFTVQIWELWTVRHEAFWDFPLSSSALDLLFECPFQQISKLIFQSPPTFEYWDQLIVENWAFPGILQELLYFSHPTHPLY